MWQDWTNLVLALWIILSGYMGFDAGTMTTNLTVTGIVMAVLAVWGALDARSSSDAYDREHSHA